MFHVPDKPLNRQDPNNRDLTSLPLNLTIRSSEAVENEIGIFSIDYIPRYARFGPLCGDSRIPSMPDEATVMPAEASNASAAHPTITAAANTYFVRFPPAPTAADCPKPEGGSQQQQSLESVLC
uniref:Uncharacterized protein n=1 Tax=Ditylenchus dipsaci TaxID=166011 RepID=A0A915DR00_9BILA